jgi:hypothetical protein
VKEQLSHVIFSVSMPELLLWGTINPTGEENSHEGVYLRRCDIDSICESGALVGKPVLIEHEGQVVGNVISAWKHDDRLDCVLRVDDRSIEGMFAQQFVQSGKAGELSLSYNITMQHSADGKLLGGDKEVMEVSLVKKGARHQCLVRGFTIT